MHSINHPDLDPLCGMFVWYLTILFWQLRNYEVIFGMLRKKKIQNVRGNIDVSRNFIDYMIWGTFCFWNNTYFSGPVGLVEHVLIVTCRSCIRFIHALLNAIHKLITFNQTLHFISRHFEQIRQNEIECDLFHFIFEAFNQTVCCLFEKGFSDQTPRFLKLFLWKILIEKNVVKWHNWERDVSSQPHRRGLQSSPFWSYFSIIFFCLY